ncbi:MAG: Bicarbonate transport ATP-binding protein CmpD [Anaerolineales bacterium]|nr:Bicarbonate transport ATP-binding protein CmpD [Anaerolineales bacterium]
MTTPKLCVDSVSKSYVIDGRPVQVLEDIDLAVWPGELVTLLGPSASGKSTLFNIIVGLEEPDEGTIRLDADIAHKRVGRVAYMPQKDLLLPWRTVLDNVILGPEIAGTAREEAVRRARELIPLFGLEGFENSYPSALSGGMRQRAALLRTFLFQKDVLLLDEPFGALDALTRMELQEWLLRVWDQFKHTILFITHDVDEAIFLSDRVYVMTPRPGRIRDVVTIGLDRPRRRAMENTSGFTQRRERLLSILRGDAT